MEKLICKESVRLATFDNWINKAVKPRDLAQSGFYFTQQRDLVKCVFCGIGILNWEEGDTPMGEHWKFSPLCRLLRHEKTDNEPIDAYDLERKLPPAPSRDEVGFGQVRGTTVSEGSIGEEARERWEHEHMRKYLVKYGYQLVPVKKETDERNHLSILIQHVQSLFQKLWW